MSATATVVERPDGYYEIRWEGEAGRARSGQIYHTQAKAAQVAADCHAQAVEFEGAS